MVWLVVVCEKVKKVEKNSPKPAAKPAKPAVKKANKPKKDVAKVESKTTSNEAAINKAKKVQTKVIKGAFGTRVRKIRTSVMFHRGHTPSSHPATPNIPGNRCPGDTEWTLPM
ncbi:Hypothetical predicted protein [Cloeon dipterum]|uniref:Large ribosomal subunit protein uL23 N-terminal domain-containing protein n=1 Tax=Cloeon dipterum TaxID=197152 RepID=A0A8S1CRU3_9INSE|nr:Hypothetical predicted protein [Cloeon dipterum]